VPRGFTLEYRFAMLVEGMAAPLVETLKDQVGWLVGWVVGWLVCRVTVCRSVEPLNRIGWLVIRAFILSLIHSLIGWLGRVGSATSAIGW